MHKKQWLGPPSYFHIFVVMEIIHVWVFHYYLLSTNFHVRICINRRSEIHHWNLNKHELWSVFCSPVCGTCSMSSTWPLWKTPSRTCASASPPSSWWPSCCWALTFSRPLWSSSRLAWYWWTSWDSCTSGISPSTPCHSSI